MVSIDIASAFDMIEHRHVDHGHMRRKSCPLIRHALAELLQGQVRITAFGATSGVSAVSKGIRQGAIDAPE